MGESTWFCTNGGLLVTTITKITTPYSQGMWKSISECTTPWTLKQKKTTLVQKYMKMSSVSNIVLNVCHKKLKHFIRQKQVLSSCKLCSGLHTHLKSKKISCFILGGDTDPFGVSYGRLSSVNIYHIKHAELTAVVKEWAALIYELFIASC